jgi:hypothetical protein
MKPKALAIFVVVALASAAPAAMIDVPQTRQEFVQAVESGKGAEVETLRIDQPLDRVFAVLEERTSACLDVQVKRTGYVGYVERSSSTYHPTLRRIGMDRVEFTLQVEHNPRGVGHVPPPGGLFMMAADLQSIDDAHTEVVLYQPKIGVKKITESLMRWFAADPAPCPKLR